MKLLHRLQHKLSNLGKAALLLALALSAQSALANPFASCITNNAGTIQFYLNEGGGTVTVVYEDGTTNSTFKGISTVNAGLQSFPLGSHTSYSIICHKSGTGTPFKISNDTNMYSLWNSPRGVDANKNPKIGYLFGRVYAGNSTPGTVGTTAQTAYDFKGRGLYMLTPDLSTNLSTGGGTNLMAVGVFANSGASGPYRMTVAADNSVYVTDFSTAAATIWQFGPSFEFTNLVLGVVGELQGFAAGIHGDPIGVFPSGSIANSNLVLYTSDPELGAPATAQLGIGGEGQTTPGSFNNLFRYTIGAGPLPWTNAPDQAVCLGLPTFQDSQILDLTVETNGYMIGMFRRANLSDGCIQVFDTNANIIFNSLQNGADAFAGSISGGGGAYGGVRVSPDGLYMATVSINNEIDVCYLTNGVPNAASMIRIANTSSTGNSRGIAFDAADNLYVSSSGQGLLRYYSLGYTSTSITTNDITGTNGGFYFALPPISASLAVTQPTASQNYINNGTPGTPIPAVFAINLNTNSLSVPVTVNFALSGSALYSTNYTLNLGTNADGVIISSNSVTFPAGTYATGNWKVNLNVTPTALPVSGPTLQVNIVLAGGSTYIPSEPVTGALSILNTGPQLLVLSAATNAPSMNRAVPNDYAEFIITRYGDLNGPGNSPGSITPTAYTVTNFTYLGTAAYPADYTAKAQNFFTPPVDGTPGIVINVGDSSITNIIGNPVARANIYQAPNNVSIVIALTNSSTGTNLTSSEGKAYSVTANSVTLTELDNAIGGEVVLWSNPLTNALDSTNWTLTFATSVLDTNHTVLPVVIPNYTNNANSSIDNGGTNDFSVLFGNPIANDGINPSPAMAANGWTTALRTTVENNVAAVAGVNVYPQGVKFQGNYAFRFSMYLRLYSRAVSNPYFTGTKARQYALFGIDHAGTNCNWRPTAAVVNGTGSGTTNSDGIWFAIDAAIDAQTPADFDAFTPAALHNPGVTGDLVSSVAENNAGVFKTPPFDGIVSRFGTFGGEPVDQWVDVSVETTMQTNISLYMNRALVLASFASTNGGGYTNGTVMLGYLNPLANVSDGSAYAYYSNVRVVELSPFITTQAASLIVTQGTSVSFTSKASFASAPLTNTWRQGVTNSIIPLQTDTSVTTNLTSTLSLTSVQVGTNYQAVFSDIAGSVTGLVANLEVIQGPTNQTVAAGSTIRLVVNPSGPLAPTIYSWKLNGTNLVNNAVYSGVATNVLVITNVQPANAGTYTVGVTNGSGGVLPSAIITVVNPTPPAFSAVTSVGTNTVINFSSTDPAVSAGTFILLSSPVVTGPYVTNPTAIFSGGSGSYQFTVPKTTNSTMFYRLQDVN